jgi:aryl-alcohol dehydrogenase-like predicted oxidoreductase
MVYGIANTTGQPDMNTARGIVGNSYRAGVRFFDTAQVYGSSERILGQCFQDLRIGSDVHVISKVDPKVRSDKMESAVESSLARLGIPRLWALLLHNESMLDQWHEPTGLAFRNLKLHGLTERLGVSIYSPERAQQALDLPEIDVIQVPANLFDRRLKRTEFFHRAAKLGKHVFIRSVYLQGLALLDEALAPVFARPAVRTFHGFCRQHQLVPAEFAVAYVRQLAPAAVLVIGAERPAQAAENCRLLALPPASETLCAEWDRHWPEDETTLINPTLWPRLN